MGNTIKTPPGTKDIGRFYHLIRQKMYIWTGSAARHNEVPWKKDRLAFRRFSGFYHLADGHG